MVDQVPITGSPKRRTFLDIQEARVAIRAQQDAEWLAEMDAMPARDGLCYFMERDNGLIKIGYSNDVGRRMGEVALQAGYAITLLATARGGRYREAYYHSLFAAHRVRGEWFSPHPDILAEIDRLPDEALSRSQRQEQAA